MRNVKTELVSCPSCGGRYLICRSHGANLGQNRTLTRSDHRDHGLHRERAGRDGRRRLRMRRRGSMVDLKSETGPGRHPERGRGDALVDSSRRTTRSRRKRGGGPSGLSPPCKWPTWSQHHFRRVKRLGGLLQKRALLEGHGAEGLAEVADRGGVGSRDGGDRRLDAGLGQGAMNSHPPNDAPLTSPMR